MEQEKRERKLTKKKQEKKISELTDELNWHIEKKNEGS